MKLEQALQSTKFQSEVRKASLNILYTAWWLRNISNQALKEYGLTTEQFNVLRILKGSHPGQLCVKNIACRMIERSSNVPRIIDRLEIKKLVKRNTSAEDKRETVISLTQAGIALLEAASKSMDKYFTDSIDMKENDAAELNRLLELVREKEQ